jgi:hypothetical protein
MKSQCDNCNGLCAVQAYVKNGSSCYSNIYCSIEWKDHTNGVCQNCGKNPKVKGAGQQYCVECKMVCICARCTQPTHPDQKYGNCCSSACKKNTWGRNGVNIKNKKCRFEAPLAASATTAPPLALAVMTAPLLADAPPLGPTPPCLDNMKT